MPFELKYGKPPDLSIIKVFGCDAYMRIPDNFRKKLDPKSRKVILVGYSSMGYRLLDLETNRVTNSCIVKFNEVKKRNDVSDMNQENLPANSQSEILPESKDAATDNPEENEIRSSKRNTKPQPRFNDYYLYSAFVANPDPILFEDLKKLPINEQNL